MVDCTLFVRQTQDNLAYAGLIKQMDDAIGVVQDAIEEMRLDKNMMIVFTNDNDGIITGDAYSSSQLSLRSGKGRQWEGGIRVPLLMLYPNCPFGIIYDVPVIGTDFIRPYLISQVSRSNRNSIKTVLACCLL